MRGRRNVAPGGMGRVHADALKSIGVRAPISEALMWQNGHGLRGFEEMITEINGHSQ